MGHSGTGHLPESQQQMMCSGPVIRHPSPLCMAHVLEVSCTHIVLSEHTEYVSVHFLYTAPAANVQHDHHSRHTLRHACEPCCWPSSLGHPTGEWWWQTIVSSCVCWHPGIRVSAFASRLSDSLTVAVVIVEGVWPLYLKLAVEKKAV